jgi:hypothetical protein
VKNDKYCENAKCPSNVKNQSMKTKQLPHRSGAPAPNKTIGYAN